MKIIEKIKKLLAHANSAKEINSLGEAQLFAEKIQSLLDEHNLTMSDVEMEAEKSAPLREIAIFCPKKVQQWQVELLTGIGKPNGCRTLFNDYMLMIVGAETDVILTEKIFQYFHLLVRDFAERESLEYKKSPGYKRARKKAAATIKFKLSYCVGFSNQLSHRLNAQHKQASAASSNEQALVFIGNKMSRVDSYVSETIKPKINTQRPIALSKLNKNAVYKGISAAESVALTHKTVEKNNEKRK